MNRKNAPIIPGEIRLITHKHVTDCTIAKFDKYPPNNKLQTPTLTPISDIAGTGTILCIRKAIGTSQKK